MILRYELKRIFSKRLTRYSLVLVIFLAIIFSVFSIGSMSYVNENGVTERGVLATRQLVAKKNQWKGTLTPQILSKVVNNEQKLSELYPTNVPEEIYAEESQSYGDIQEMINQIFSENGEYNPYAIVEISQEQEMELYSIREKNIQGLIQEYGKTAEQQKFIESQFSKEKTPFYYEAADSWKTMLMYATTYGLFLVVVIGLLSATIFADEGADAIFFSTKFGRSKAVFSKLIASVIMTTTVYWGGIGLLSIISFGVMGISGFQTPYRIEQSYSLYEMTCGQAYLLVLLCGYVASLLSASISMLISSKIGSTSIAVCAPVLVFCVSPFIGRALSYNTFFQLTPDQLMNVLNSAKIPYIYQINSLVFRQIPFIVLFYMLLSLSILPLIYAIYKSKIARI